MFRYRHIFGLLSLFLLSICVFDPPCPAQTFEAYDFFFLDELHGWVLVSKPKQEILRTSDGGQTWKHIPVQVGIGKLKFWDERTGLGLNYVRGGADVFRTSDGGETWAKVNEIRQESLNVIDGFAFASQDSVFLVGEKSMGLGWVGQLTDGARKLRVRDDLPINFDEQSNTIGVFGDGKGNVWITGKELIIHSEDGGVKWEDQTTNAAPRIDLGLSGASLPGGHAWFAAANFAIYGTVDYGKHWSRSLDARNDWMNFNSLSFLNPSNGCAVGISSYIYCTHDGGANWSKERVFDQIPNGTPYPSSIVLFGSLRGWAIVNHTLYKTEDAGHSFTKAFPEPVEDLAVPQALRTIVNGPTQLSFDDNTGKLFILEMMENKILSLDVARGVLEVTWEGHDVSPWKKDLWPTSLVASNAGELFIGTGDGHIARFDDKTKAFVDLSSELSRSPGNNVIEGIAIDDKGSPVVTAFHKVFRWNPQLNSLEILAGSTAGYGGDGGISRDARLQFPMGIGFNGKGDVFIADYQNCRIRKIDHETRIIQTIAGDGKCESRGDGGRSVEASVNYPSALAVDVRGNVYFVDGAKDRIRCISPDGMIATYAGTGKRGFSGDGGPAPEAMLNNPSGIAVDSAGNLYIAEYVNNRIRRVDAKTHIITTVAGTGQPLRIDQIM